MLLQLVRRLHVGLTSRAAETSLLAKLRKKTGYTIANCKKALEMHKNDADKAESWLNAQAQEMGWAKATKLAGRDASQGLVAARCSADGRYGALVELNCETDFVARNDRFKQMIEEAAAACFKFAHTCHDAKGPVTKMSLDGEQLGGLPGGEGKTLGERLALMIGAVGENAVLRRATCWKSHEPGVRLVGYTHPAPAAAAYYSAGKYGALLAYKQSGSDAEIARKICQHIIGLNPKKIGAEADKPAKESDDETCLIHQEFLLDPSVTVAEVLAEHGVVVVDYVRFACGESSDPVALVGEKQPLESVQTLQ